MASIRILVTVSGHDTPGITAKLTGVLCQHPTIILDITQAVIHGLLSLSLLFECQGAHENLLQDLQREAGRLGLKMEHQILKNGHAKTPTLPLHHYAVTLIADELTAQSIHRVARALAEWGMNITAIKRLSEADFSCAEMLASSPEKADRRKELLALAREIGVDIALQEEGLYRRAKRLVVLDMDSTLIQSEVIDELAREKGAYEEVAKITREAMGGKLDYDTSLKLRCEKLKGLTMEDLHRVFSRVELTDGAKDLIRVLKKLGYKTALISGGFTFVAEKLKEKLGIDYAYANTLELEGSASGKTVTGRVIPPIINAQRKADLLELIAQQEKIELDQVIAIGDGANDLLMLEKAGLGIAFNAKPAVREKADLALSRKNLRSILYLLGLSEKDVAEAIQSE